MPTQGSTTPIKCKCVSFALAFATAVGLAVSSSAAGAVTVNCEAGESLQSALDLGLHKQAIEIIGTCTEDIRIEHKQLVHIYGTTPGDPDASGVTGKVEIESSTGVTFSNLTIKSRGEGVTLNNSDVTLHGAVIRDTHLGVAVRNHSHLNLKWSSVKPAIGHSGYVYAGAILVEGNSTLTGLSSSVSGFADNPNIGSAVHVTGSSFVNLSGDSIVTHTGGRPAITIAAGSTGQVNPPHSSIGTIKIEGGISILGNSHLDLWNAEVAKGKITVDLHSVLQIDVAKGREFDDYVTIEDGIEVREDSAVSIRTDNVTINGNVTCADRESSLSGSFEGSGQDRCSSFGRR